MEQEMSKKKVYSVCGMCSVRCPIEAEIKDGRLAFLQGNPHAAGIKGALCARGSAGPALIYDNERPQFPMIREGERGEGRWRKTSWDEALDFVADRLNGIASEYGARSVLLSDRGGPFRDLHMAFLRGLGSPNYCNHDASCARNVQHAALSTFGIGRKDLVYDLKNSRHVILQSRNIFESINVKEVNDLTSALDKGCRLSVIDIRANISATKAHNFFLVRPGMDYAFNLAVIHTLLYQDLFDTRFAHIWIKDLRELREFVRPYTPAWAEEETGIEADRIVAFVRELAAAKPAVLWHPGWMTARYNDSFYTCRSVYLINALLGSIGAKGGLPLANKPSDVGRKGLKKLVDLFPKPQEKRADGVGWRYPHFELRPGPASPRLQGCGDRKPIPPQGVHRLSPRSSHGVSRPGETQNDPAKAGPDRFSDFQLVRHGMVFGRGAPSLPLS
jgi:thiosulfate reductase / polysulfide reductase chain A